MLLLAQVVIKFKIDVGSTQVFLLFLIVGYFYPENCYPAAFTDVH
jgi:hypothetical protein